MNFTENLNLASISFWSYYYQIDITDETPIGMANNREPPAINVVPESSAIFQNSD